MFLLVSIFFNKENFDQILFFTGPARSVAPIFEFSFFVRKKMALRWTEAF